MQISKFKQETVEENSSTTGPPVGIEPKCTVNLTGGGGVHFNTII